MTILYDYFVRPKQQDFFTIAALGTEIVEGEAAYINP